MAIDLTGRVCVITGAARGIGAEVARKFAKRGGIVVATDRNEPQIAEAALNLVWDVRDSARAAEVMQLTAEKFERVDCFVANAGYFPLSQWDEITDELWEELVDINLTGAWHGIREAAKIMVKQGYGKIVGVSSIQAKSPGTSQIPYIAAKTGVVGLTQAMSRALGKQGVRVNCIAPGAVLTESEVELFPDRKPVDAVISQRQSLEGRLMPDEIEPTFAFLCSEESDAITGQTFCVDKGFIHW